MGISAVSHCHACNAAVNRCWMACLVCNAPLPKVQATEEGVHPKNGEIAVPRFTPGQNVFITDNENRYEPASFNLT